MSVHQVEEYYVHVDIPANKKEVVDVLAIDQGWDYELNEDSITVDGFESTGDAEQCDDMIHNMISI